MDLQLLDPERVIIKQGILRKTANLDSAETHMILFDHYLVIARKKVVHAVDHYIIQKRVKKKEYRVSVDKCGIDSGV